MEIAKFLAPNAGEMVRLLGEPRVFKITPTENGGSFLQFETAHAPGTGIPPHLHREEVALALQYGWVMAS